MIRVYDDKTMQKQKPKVITIRVKDPDLILFLKWITETKGNASEFTRQLWKLTEEWEEWRRAQNIKKENHPQEKRYEKESG